MENQKDTNRAGRLFDKIAVRFKWFKLVAVYDAGAAIPPENRVVITDGAHALGLFKTIHRLPEQLV